ncbi:hypothetical protein [Halovivax sp.]|uniref:DUF7344 domain-containing protein n=1 Tax=Halovivax sp. TaxID=1935978 RepID=UPI0025BFE871|nr:hypothetical protein [Halovivax sp.]
MVTLHPRSIETDAFHALLADSRRRRLLAHLRRHRQSSLAECVRAIVEREGKRSLADDGARERVAISLVHDHLPRLADYDIVEYDAEARTVSVGDAFDDLAAALEGYPERSRAPSPHPSDD